MFRFLALAAAALVATSLGFNVSMPVDLNGDGLPDSTVVEEIRRAYSHQIDPFQACRGCPAFQESQGRVCHRHTKLFMKSVGERTKALSRSARRLLCASSCDELPIDIDLVAREQGVAVVESNQILSEDLPDSIWGFLHQGNDLDTIVVNHRMSERKKNLTIAHELAEWHLGIEPHLLRRETGDPGSLANDYALGRITGKLDDELRADVFAMETLVPTPALLREIMAGKSLSCLADTFDVEPIVIILRHWLLGIDPTEIDMAHIEELFQGLGPWGRLLDQRLYGGKSVEETHTLPMFIGQT